MHIKMEFKSCKGFCDVLHWGYTESYVANIDFSESYFRCYIGRRQLEAAIKTLERDASFSVTYKPFLLDANTKPEGIPLQVYFISKYGEKISKQEFKGNGPIAKAGKSVVSDPIAKVSIDKV